MTGFSVKPLDESTWPDFARLVERHNGVWGGCWCMAFHAEGVGRRKTVAQNRSEKECRYRRRTRRSAKIPDSAKFDPSLTDLGRYQAGIPAIRIPSIVRSVSSACLQWNTEATARALGSPAQWSEWLRK